MASPGYPQMGQQPMMQQPYPMGGPMQRGAPMRRGTSRAVPVVVSAGLAVGVFCGLLFGLGTGTTEAAPEPAKGNNVKAGATAEAAPTPTTPAATNTTPPPTTNTTAVATTGGGTAKNPAAVGGGTGGAPTPATGSGAAPTVSTIKLTVEITPEAAAEVAKIVIDGKEITGKSTELPVDKKSVKVSITATGFHSVDKKIDLAGPGDTTIKQEMAKRATGTASPGFGGASSGGNHVPTAPPKLKKPPSNNGIIDI